MLLRYPARAWQTARVPHLEQTSDVPAFVGSQITLQAEQRLRFHERDERS